MHILTRPILEIDLNNLLNNYKSLKALSRHAQAAAVVKDDAYGLHADIVAKKLYEEGGCRHFFVAHGIEGERIRNLVPEAAIYVLQGIGEDSVDSFRRCRLIPVIGSPEMFAWWKENRIEGIKPVIQVETGLNRLGFRETDLEKLSDADKNEFSMILSHLACADAKEHFMNQHQLDNFRRLKEKYFPKLPASLSASDGTFLGAEYQWDLVRLGAAMYGINTAPYRENQMKSVVTVKAPVLQIADLPKGDFVGYSATYRATENRRLAIVSIGYGDGIPRSLSNVGKVFFNICGKIHEARVLGRLSMDNIICDVTGIDNLQIGDLAGIITDYYTLDDMGRDAGTISYEILSRIGKNTRYIRTYIGAQKKRSLSSGFFTYLLLALRFSSSFCSTAIRFLTIS